MVLGSNGGPVPPQIEAIHPSHALPPSFQVQERVSQVPCWALGSTFCDLKRPPTTEFPPSIPCNANQKEKLPKFEFGPHLQQDSKLPCHMMQSERTYAGTSHDCHAMRTRFSIRQGAQFVSVGKAQERRLVVPEEGGICLRCCKSTQMPSCLVL